MIHTQSYECMGVNVPVGRHSLVHRLRGLGIKADDKSLGELRHLLVTQELMRKAVIDELR